LLILALGVIEVGHVVKSSYYVNTVCLNLCSVLLSAYISVKDAESGVRNITASIYDKTLKVIVWTETRPAVTLQSADSKQKRVSGVIWDMRRSFLFNVM